MPTHVLSGPIRRLLRRALASDPAVRPRASEWVRALRAALEEVWSCPACNHQHINDDVRDCCPCCGARAETRKLLARGGEIVLRRPGVTVGRAVLGGHDVSLAHAVFGYEGHRLTIRDTSRYGTFIFKSSWLRLPANETIELRPRDVLRFGAGTTATVR